MAATVLVKQFAASSAPMQEIHGSEPKLPRGRPVLRDFADTVAMRRPLALLLAFALLFQMSWAVAATYCGHETSPQATAHFGHHAHVHKAADVKKDIADQFAVDDDCSGCHAGHAALIPMACAGVTPESSASTPLATLSSHGSVPARAPDRPQWLRLA